LRPLPSSARRRIARVIMSGRAAARQSRSSASEANRPVPWMSRQWSSTPPMRSGSGGAAVTVMAGVNLRCWCGSTAAYEMDHLELIASGDVGAGEVLGAEDAAIVLDHHPLRRHPQMVQELGDAGSSLDLGAVAVDGDDDG